MMASAILRAVEAVSESEPEDDITPAKREKVARKPASKKAQRAKRPARKVLAVKKFVFKMKGQGVQKMPAHGWTDGKVWKSMSLKLPRAPQLDLHVVSEGWNSDDGVKANGARRFRGERVFRSWSTIRCFSATTAAAVDGNVSERGISDLANQIRFSKVYKQALIASGERPGRFLTPSVAEFISGLPIGWTSDARGAVCKPTVDAQWPAASHEAGIPSISLFSGVGGLDLALRRWFRPTEFVESSPYCRAVLASRMAEGNLPRVPISLDVCGFHPTSDESQRAEVLTAGFPCQGVSAAGAQEGLGDARSGLVRSVFTTFDAIPTMRALVMENVAALMSKNKNCRKLLAYVVKECCKRGLVVYWATLSVHNVGLAMGRKRVFLFACKPGQESDFFKDLPPTLGSLIEAPWNAQNNIPIEKWLSDRQGKTDRARLHSLGNIVVPQQAFAAASCLKVLMEKANE